MITPTTEAVSGSVLQLQTGYGTDGLWLDIDDHLAKATMKNGRARIHRLGMFGDVELGAPYTIGKPNEKGHIPLIMVRGASAVAMNNGKELFLRIGDMHDEVREDFNWTFFSPQNSDAVVVNFSGDSFLADPKKEAIEPIFRIMPYYAAYLSEDRIFVRTLRKGDPAPIKHTERWLAWDLNFKEVPHILATELTRLRDSLPAIEKLSLALTAKVAIIKHEPLAGGNTNVLFMAWSETKSRVIPVTINGFGLPPPDFIEMAPDGKHFYAVHNWLGASIHDIYLGRVITTDSLPIVETILLQRFDEYGSFTAAWYGDSKALGVMNTQGQDESHPVLYSWEMSDALFNEPRNTYKPPKL